MKQGFDYIGVGIGAMIINKERKALLNLRGKKAKNESGLWEFPGGGMDYGETFECTLVREMQEEFGFIITPLEVFSVFNHIIPAEKQHWVAVCMLCKIKSGTPKILEPEKSEKIGWFTLSEIAKLKLTPPSKNAYLIALETFPDGSFPDFYS